MPEAPLPDLVGTDLRARWAALAAAHPDVVTVHPHGLEVCHLRVDLGGALAVRERQHLPAGLLAFGWSGTGPPEAHVLVHDGRPGLVLVLTDTDRLVHVGRDLHDVLRELTTAVADVLDQRHALPAERLEPDELAELEPEDLLDELGVVLEEELAARVPLLEAYRWPGDVAPPPLASTLPLAEDAELAHAVAAAGDAWGRGLPPDPARTHVLDLRDHAPGPVADLGGLTHGLPSGTSCWGGVDPTGRILTWRLEDPPRPPPGSPG